MNDELYHYGVKGMKWGVRRNRSPSERALNLKAKRQIRKERRDFNRNILLKSDDEIEAMNRRLEKENRFSDNYSRNNAYSRIGREAIRDSLKTAAGIIATSLAVQAGRKIVESMLPEDFTKNMEWKKINKK